MKIFTVVAAFVVALIKGIFGHAKPKELEVHHVRAPLRLKPDVIKRMRFIDRTTGKR